MSDPTIVVGLDRGETTERVSVSAVRVEQDRDGTVRCFNADDREIATFYDAVYAVKADHLED